MKGKDKVPLFFFLLYVFFIYLDFYDGYVGGTLLVFNRYPCASLYFPSTTHIGVFMGLILTKG